MELAEVTVSNSMVGGLLAALGLIIGFLAKLQGQGDRIVNAAVARAKAEIASEPPVREIIGKIAQDHPCVKGPEFDAHRTDCASDRNKLWENWNGLRRELSGAQAALAAMQAVREENTARLKTIEEKVDASASQVSTLVGEMKQVCTRVDEAARDAKQAANTATAALTEAQHKKA